MKKTTTLILIIVALVFFGIYYMISQIPISEPDPQDQTTAVLQYVRNNISELSPEPAVLGGTFYVTDIKAENGSGTVSYEDGHIALQGTFSYTIDVAGNVIIENFSIPFDDVGNIVRAPTTGWNFLYEEPGQPALSIELEFTDQSQCKFKGGEILCLALSSDAAFKQGMRVGIIGTRTKNTVAVSSLTEL